MIADPAYGAWTFGASILSFAFPMLLFIVVATWLYVAYTKPELVPGHPTPRGAPGVLHPGPGPPSAAAGAAKAETEGGE